MRKMMGISFALVAVWMPFATFYLYCVSQNDVLVLWGMGVWSVAYLILFGWLYRRSAKIHEVMSGASESQGVVTSAGLQIILLQRLLARGPECVNQLSIEFLIPNDQITTALRALQEKGLASKRMPRPFFHRPVAPIPEGEERWGAF